MYNIQPANNEHQIAKGQRTKYKVQRTKLFSCSVVAHFVRELTALTCSASSHCSVQLLLTSFASSQHFFLLFVLTQKEAKKSRLQII